MGSPFSREVYTLCNRTLPKGIMFNLAVIAGNLVLWTHNLLIAAQYVS